MAGRNGAGEGAPLPAGVAIHQATPAQAVPWRRTLEFRDDSGNGARKYGLGALFE
jgi:hypothetical protein